MKTYRFICTLITSEEADEFFMTFNKSVGGIIFGNSDNNHYKINNKKLIYTVSTSNQFAKGKRIIYSDVRLGYSLKAIQNKTEDILSIYVKTSR